MGRDQLAVCILPEVIEDALEHGARTQHFSNFIFLLRDVQFEQRQRKEAEPPYPEELAVLFDDVRDAPLNLTI